MIKTHAAPERGGNRLLARLPQDEYRRIRPLLQDMSSKLGQVLYEAHSPIDYVYFPIQSTLSAIVVMENGSAIEVATIGSEGAAGLSIPLGDRISLYRVIVQIEDGMQRVPADRLQREIDRGGVLRDLLLSYQAAFFAQVSQSVACNGLHPIQQRCCRWLLMTHDRAPSDLLRITHEFLAIMLGVRRPSVTEVLQALQKKGLIHCGRGKIEVIDRPGLEAASCECYGAIKREYEHLLG